MAAENAPTKQIRLAWRSPAYCRVTALPLEEAHVAHEML
jgi:hypothetical protein